MLPRIAALIAGLGLTGLAQAATHYPLTVDNCGMPQTFAHAPERAVTIGQAGTEILYALGLGHTLAGTSLWFNNVLPEFKAMNDKVERLADNDPSFEAVVGKRPQLVAVQFEWMVGAQGVVGTREQFDELKIPTYLLPSDCEGKDNLVGADGTRLQAFQVDSIYKSVSQLAEIFDVQDRGATLNADLKGRLDSATAQLAGRTCPTPRHYSGSPAPTWISTPMWLAAKASPTSCCAPWAYATWSSPPKNGRPWAGKPWPRPTRPG